MDTPSWNGCKLYIHSVVKQVSKSLILFWGGGAMPFGLPDSSSPTRARTCALSTSAVEAQSLNNGLPGKIVKEYILF